MVKIYWDPLSTLRSESAAVPDVPRLKSPSLDNEADKGLSDNTSRLTLPGLQLIDSRLRDFDKALSSFKWPKAGFPMSQSRLVKTDSRLEGKVNAELPAPGEVTRYYKYFSGSLRGDRETTLDPGDYKMVLTLGNKSDSFTVTVEQGMTNAELVEAVAVGVNASTVKARGHHIKQSGNGLEVPGLNRTGHILGLSVNNAYEDQNLSITGTDVHLKNYLRLEATNTPTTWPTAQRYDVTVGRTYAPSTFVTKSFDPNADPGLASGVYDMTLTLGDQTQAIQVGVGEDDDWRDVLNSMAGAIGGSGLATARVVDSPRRSDLVTDPAYYLMMDGVALEITALEPKVGERLRLSGGEHGGNGAFEVFNLADNTLSVTKEQYDALVDGSKASLSPDSGATLPAPLDSSTDYYVRKFGTDTATEESVEVVKYLVQFSTSQDGAKQGTDIVDITDSGSGAFSMDLGDVFSPVGLPKTARPGADGQITVNGRTSIESPGVFTQDQGRLILETEDATAKPLPVKVVKALDGLESSMARVTESYNALIRTLDRNSDIMEPGFKDRFTAPLARDVQNLKLLGLKELADGQAFFDADAFYAEVGGNPDRAEETLMGSKGLIPAWEKSVDEVLENGVENYQADKEDDPLSTSPRTETELEKKNQLVDLLDTLPQPATVEPDLDSPGRFFNLKG